MAEIRTYEQIQGEILLEQEKLKDPLPFDEQETILKRIIELLKERSEVDNG